MVVSKPISAVPAEERLVEYAHRLKRHRAGRVGVWVNLSRLAPAYRPRLTDLMIFTRNALAPLVAGERGEIFSLVGGDVVAVLREPPQERLTSILLRLDYAFRKDLPGAFDGAAADDGDTPDLCDLYAMESDYESFLQRSSALYEAVVKQPGVLAQKSLLQAAEAAPGGLMERDGAVERTEREKLELDHEGLLGGPEMLGGADATIDFADRRTRLSSLLTSQNFGLFQKGRAGDLIIGSVRGLSIHRDQLIEAFELKREASRTPKVIDRFVEEGERALLIQSPKILDRLQALSGVKELYIQLSLQAYFSVELLEAGLIMDRSEQEGLHYLVPVAEARADRSAFAYLHDFAHDHGLSLGLAGVPIDQALQILDHYPHLACLGATLTPASLGRLDPRDVIKLRDYTTYLEELSYLFTGIDTPKLLEAARLLGGSVLAGRLIDQKLHAREAKLKAAAREAESKGRRGARQQPPALLGPAEVPGAQAVVRRPTSLS